MVVENGTETDAASTTETTTSEMNMLPMEPSTHPSESTTSVVPNVPARSKFIESCPCLYVRL